MSVKTRDDINTSLLVDLHHFTQLFRVELRGERGGTHHVTEHHRQLSALAGITSSVGRGCWVFLRFPDSPVLRFFPRPFAGPHQDGAVLVDRQPSGLDDLFLEVRDVVVVEVELALERSVGHPPLAPQQFEHLLDHRRKLHDEPSTKKGSHTGLPLLVLLTLVTNSIQTCAQRTLHRLYTNAIRP